MDNKKYSEISKKIAGEIITYLRNKADIYGETTYYELRLKESDINDLAEEYGVKLEWPSEEER